MTLRESSVWEPGWALHKNTRESHGPTLGVAEGEKMSLTRVGGWCGGGDWCQVHLRNVKVVTVVRVLGSAHTAEVSAECF